MSQMTDQPKRNRWKRRAPSWYAWVESCAAGLAAFVGASSTYYLTETPLLPLNVSGIIGVGVAASFLCMNTFRSD